jgi:Flp pilus assembly protein TadD
VVALSLVLGVTVWLVHGSAQGHTFLPSHDDGDCVLWNPVVRAPPVDAIRGAFTTAPLGAWAPLHQLSHRLDRALFGNWAGGYVLVNMAWHALAALLLALLVLQLGGGLAAAFLAAMVFAVHPVQVESVVWISQRKTVMAVAFMLVTLNLWVTYASADDRRRLPIYLFAVAAAAAALLSKAVAVILPVALVLVDVSLGRIRFRPGWFLEKLPFVALAVAVALATVASKGEVASLVSEGGHTRMAAGAGPAWHGGGPVQTFLTMVTVLPRYLGILAWPANLSAVYLPTVRTSIDLEVVLGLSLLAGLVVVGVTLARRRPRLFLWFALFFLGLLPVSQIFPQVTLMNDRYLYAPMIGAAAMAGDLVATLLRRLGGAIRPALVVTIGASLLALGMAARARVPTWRDDLSLWTDTVSKAPRSPHAWYNLARAREASGDLDGALPAYLRTIELDPLDDHAAVNAGAIYLRRGDLARAAPLVVQGAGLGAGSVEAQFNLGLLRFLQGDLVAAEAPLVLAAALAPDACAVHALRGHVSVLSGEADSAVARYREAEALGCAEPETEIYRAYAESLLGDDEGARRRLKRGIADAVQRGREYLGRSTLRPLLATHGFARLVQLGTPP